MRGFRFLKGDETECKTEGGAKQEDESRKLMKKPKHHLMPIFSQGCFMLKVGFIINLVLCLTHSPRLEILPKNASVLKLVERFSGHCRAIKS